MRAAGAGFGLLMLMVPAGTMAGEAACDLTAARHYPVLEVLRAEAAALDQAEYARIDPAFWADVDAVLAGPSGQDYRAAVTEALDLLPPAERDLRLLALLDRVSDTDLPTAPLTTASPSALTDEFLALLDRQGLAGQAAALRAAQASFPLWGRDAGQRRLMWQNPSGAAGGAAGGKAGGGIGAALVQSSADWAAARPTVAQALAAHLAAHPDLAARYEARRAQATEEDRRAYLSGLLWACIGPDWWRPDQTEAALAPLPQTARDLVLADLFLTESGDGSALEVFASSAGAFAPDWAAALDRMGLPERAATIRQGMAAFGTPYPQDSEARLARLNALPADIQAGLAAQAWGADDPAVLAALVAHAKAAGLWPQ